MQEVVHSTPLMKQYWEIKNQFQDSILLFRLGDFYEMFFDDAKTAAPILDIALTSRDKSSANPVPLCGIPYHSAQAYLTKLLDQGLKIAVCEQVEDPKTAKGIVKREVVRVITPGLRTDQDGLPATTVNPLIAVHAHKGKFGLAWLEVSSGSFRTTSFATLQEVENEIRRLAPRELLMTEGFSPALELSDTLTQTRMPAWLINDASLELARRFELANLDGLGLQDMEAVTPAAWLLVYYVERQNKTSLPHLETPQPYFNSDILFLDVATQEHLDLFPKGQQARDTSLYSVLNQTQTHAGARLLKEWVSFPPQNTEQIEARLNTLEELISLLEETETMRELLKQTGDLERVIARIASKRCLPRDFVSLRETLILLPEIKKFLKKFQSEILTNILNDMGDHGLLLEELQKAIAERPAPTLKDGGVLKDGYSEELDRLRHITRNGKAWIQELEQQERKVTGISNLKIGYNRVFGYFFDVSKSHLEKVPENYIRKQTLANGERYITPELKQQEDTILQAEEKILSLEEQLFEVIRGRVETETRVLQVLAKALAKLDVLCSLAKVSLVNQYVRPVMHKDSNLHIKGGRHAVLEHFVRRGDFIANDVELNHEDKQLIVLTGPNMSGKSTIMRQVALITLLGHMGCFVPAAQAYIPPVDRIFTRVGASDDIASGKSTFMVEMSETASILRNATQKSLVLLDEIGRGTSTFDGLSIAWAVAEYLHDHLRCKTIFATHYHELTDLSLTKAKAVNMHVAVKEWKGDIIFMRKLAEGAVNRSYGIAVAKLAGVLPQVLTRAREVLKNLEKGELNALGLPSLAAESTFGQSQQLQLFKSIGEELFTEFKRQDLDALSPLKALELLYEWKNRYLNN